MTTDLAGLDRARLKTALAPLDPRPYVADQIFRWMYGRRETDFARMTDLGQALRERLAASCRVGFPVVESRHAAADGTVRYAYRLEDGLRTESVWIPGEPGQVTLCLSSQVGCALACGFCVSGLAGVERNLGAGEIVGQALRMLADATPGARTNIVFMGMGEALLNLEQVVQAFTILADPAGPGIALKRMTLSTAGHVAALERFAALRQRPRLAVSLNASSDAVREKIMPINRTWPIAALLAACRSFPLAKGERITFEYVLLGGVNDSEADALRLPGLLAGIPCKVNLIPWNPAPGLPFTTCAPDDVGRFAAILHRHHVRVTVRRRRGADAGAACGQLALHREAVSPR